MILNIHCVTCHQHLFSLRPTETERVSKHLWGVEHLYIHINHIFKDLGVKIVLSGIIGMVKSVVVWYLLYQNRSNIYIVLWSRGHYYLIVCSHVVQKPRYNVKCLTILQFCWIYAVRLYSEACLVQRTKWAFVLIACCTYGIWLFY